MWEIVDKVSKMKTRKERLDLLRSINTFGQQGQPFKLLLRMAFDKNLKWHLPEGEPPYKTEPGEALGMVLWHEIKRLYIFFEGPHVNQRVGNNPEDKKKLFKMRETNFINLLASLDPKDAKLVVAVKDKKLHKLYPGIDLKLIKEAYPELYTNG